MQVFKKKDEQVVVLCSLELWENLFFVPLAAKEWFGEKCFVIGTNTVNNDSPFVFLCDMELEADDIRILGYQLLKHPEKFETFDVVPNIGTMGFDFKTSEPEKRSA